MRPRGLFMGHKTIYPQRWAVFMWYWVRWWTIEQFNGKRASLHPFYRWGTWSPSPLLPEWSTGRRASFKSEDEEHMLRKGLGRRWLPWAVVSALGCLHLDFLLREKNDHLLVLVTVAGLLSQAATTPLTDTDVFTHSLTHSPSVYGVLVVCPQSANSAHNNGQHRWDTHYVQCGACAMSSTCLLIGYSQ